MPAARPPALKILYIAANPSATERLRLDSEIREVDRKIRDSPHSDGILVDPCWAADADDLQRAILERAPHIVHFSGHGAQGGLLVEPHLHGRGLVTAEALVGLLRIVNRDVQRVRAVLLNACHSADLLDALTEFVDCAIGMRAAVPDHVAIGFSGSFYQAVASGRSLQDAFALARNRVLMDWPEYVHAPQIQARRGARLTDVVLLPPAGSLLAPPRGPLDASGRWLTGQDLKIGDLLAEGRFTLVEWLGQGTFATVWRARESGSNREVALKILHDRYSGDLVMHERFFRGARLMKQFNHTAIVQVLDPCVVWHGYRFFVMDYVRGRTLMDYTLEHGLAWRDVLAYGLEIGNALAYAHERGCIHRDIKPANILIDGKGHAKLIDFDLVRDLYVEGGTRPGGMGTVAYAAPEALDRPGEADGRADEYSLALTLASAIAGREPTRHDKRDPKVFIAQLRCPREVRDVLGRASAWEPSERYSSVLGFCAALQEAVRDVARAERRKRLAVRTGWMSVGGLGLGLGFGLWIWLSGAPEATNTPTPRPVEAPSTVNAPAPQTTTNQRDTIDARLDAALRVDHSQTRYTIRVSSDDDPADARRNALVVARAGEFQPWLVYDQFRSREGKLLRRVNVGDYTSFAAASADRLRAKQILGEGAQVIDLASECPIFRYDPAGYHECDDPAKPH